MDTGRVGRDDLEAELRGGTPDGVREDTGVSGGEGIRGEGIRGEWCDTWDDPRQVRERLRVVYKLLEIGSGSGSVCQY